METGSLRRPRLFLYRNHRCSPLYQKGVSRCPANGIGVVCSCSAGVCGGFVPPVFSGREPYLCCPGRSTEHGPALAACPAGQFLRSQRPASHRAGNAVSCPLLPGRKQLHTPVCIYGQCRAGTFIPEPQPLRTVSAGSGPRPFRARHTLLCNGTALRRSSAVPASDRLSGCRRPRHCRAGKGAAHCDGKAGHSPCAERGGHAGGVCGFGGAKVRGKYNEARQWFTTGVSADNGYA